MKAGSIIAMVLRVFVVIPIWYYLIYSILTTIEASELMMFLFWVYVPVNVLCAIIEGIVNASKKLNESY